MLWIYRVNSAVEIKTKKGEKNIKRTPCMVEGITDHIWSWKELLMFKVRHINYILGYNPQYTHEIASLYSCFSDTDFID